MKRYCNKCNQEVQVIKPEHNNENDDYSYECFNCDESLFEMETHTMNSNRMRLKIINSEIIVKPLRGKLATFIEEVEVVAHPRPCKMIRAKLDVPTDVGGSIISKVVFFPKECFEVINDEKK